jgi:hypothetical protein
MSTPESVESIESAEALYEKARIKAVEVIERLDPRLEVKVVDDKNSPQGLSLYFEVRDNPNSSFGLSLGELSEEYIEDTLEGTIRSTYRKHVFPKPDGYK